MIHGNVNCPLTTSLGRIFDAAAAVLGLVDHTSYEGEGPVKLEGKGLRAHPRQDTLAGRDIESLLPFLPGPGDGRLFLVDPRPLLAALMEKQEPIPRLALCFHEAIAMAAVEGARRMRRHTGVSRLALSGGVFQNILLRELLIPLLIKEGFEVFLNVRSPAGDGGLAVGQAWFEES
jgi:hydrogenase maturation protein HypF